MLIKLPSASRRFSMNSRGSIGPIIARAGCAARRRSGPAGRTTARVRSRRCPRARCRRRPTRCRRPDRRPATLPLVWTRPITQPMSSGVSPRSWPALPAATVIARPGMDRTASIHGPIAPRAVMGVPVRAERDVDRHALGPCRRPGRRGSRPRRRAVWSRRTTGGGPRRHRATR